MRGGGVEQQEGVSYFLLQCNCTHCSEKQYFVAGHCLGCGNPVDESELNTVSADALSTPVTDKRIIDQIENNLGWFCSSCGSFSVNLPKNNPVAGICKCVNCGSDYDSQDGDFILPPSGEYDDPRDAIRAMIRLGKEAKTKSLQKGVRGGVVSIVERKNLTIRGKRQRLSRVTIRDLKEFFRRMQ